MPIWDSDGKEYETNVGFLLEHAPATRAEEVPIIGAPLPAVQPIEGEPRIELSTKGLQERFEKFTQTLKPLFSGERFKDQSELITEEDYAKARSEYTSFERAVAAAANVVAGTALTGAPLRTGVGLFGGVLAEKAPMRDPKKWFTGADDKLRFEIDDSKASYI